jgi:hypothetical protein
MAEQPTSGAEILAAHLKDCVKADAAIVVDGNGDDVIATLLAAGWTWDGNAEVIAGKRIRNLVPPPEVAERLFNRNPEREDQP